MLRVYYHDTFEYVYALRKKKRLIARLRRRLDLIGGNFNRLVTKFGHQHPATLDDVLLVDGIVDLPALFAAAHQAQVLEDAQVMGDGGLRHGKGFHYVTDAHLALKQHLQDGLARFIGQSLAEGYATNHNRWSHGTFPGTHIDGFQYVNILPQICRFVKLYLDNSLPDSFSSRMGK